MRKSIFQKQLFISFLFLLIASTAFPQVSGRRPQDYYVREFIDVNGKTIFEVIAPERPPANYRAPAVELPRFKGGGVNVLGSVPAFDWTYGCSPTAAAMLTGYYDNIGYPDMYTGPENGGIVPLDNSGWGVGQSPLSATHIGFDGRAINGHVEDYYIDYGNTNSDPFTGVWPEHTHGDCTGDYMGTSQSKFGNSDGTTTFFYYPDGNPLIDYTGSEPNDRDGCHGVRLFVESRGYSVVENYNQPIFGFDWDGDGTVYEPNTLGFTYDQYKAEIDAGRPVLIHISGHTMLGFGYDANSNLIYLHDTWDYSSHTMIWGGDYDGRKHFGVTVIELVQSLQGLPLCPGESYDFSDGNWGSPSDGDFYLSANGSFYANNVGQRGIVDLGDIGDIRLNHVVIPTSGYSMQEVPPVIGHTYVSLAQAGEEGNHIVFRVLGFVNNCVVLDFFYSYGLSLCPEDSYDFSDGVFGSITGGDLYYDLPSGGLIWANNVGQRGVIDLGDIGTGPLDQVPIPTSGYSRQGIPAVIGHTYVSLAQEGEEGNHIVFRVLDLVNNCVVIDFLYVHGAAGLTLCPEDSYDFSEAVFGSLNCGDLYFLGGSFWANNVGQRGVIDLGDIGTGPLDQAPIPTSGYSRQEVPAIIGHTYVSLAQEGEEGNHIVFRVMDIVNDCVIIDFFYVHRRSIDSSLSDLRYDGIQVPGFDPGTLIYHVILLQGTTIVPTVTAVPNDVNASLSITQAAGLPGTAKVEVTAEDGNRRTYDINFTVDQGGGPPNWLVSPQNFELDGEVQAVVEIDGVEFNTPGGILGAFVGDQCRGVQDTGLPFQGRMIYIIRCYTNLPGNDVLDFKFFDGTQVFDLIETVPFVANMVVGNALDPFVFHNGTIGPNDDASLSDLQIDQTTVPGFDPGIYTYDFALPCGTTIVPTVYGTPRDANAIVAYIDATSIPGTTYIDVTAEDGTTERRYTINFTAPCSDDATLSDLQVDQTTVTGFDPGTLSYDVELAEGTTVVPTVTATTNHPNAGFVVNDAAGLPGTTTVDVTAEDGVATETYSVNFTVAGNPNYPDWTPPGGVQYTMTVHGQVTVLGSGLITSTGSLIAGFADGTCLGVAEIYDGPAGRQFNLSLGTNNDQVFPVSFMAYDFAADEVLTIAETHDFVNNTVVGGIVNPFLFHAGMIEQIISLVHGWNWLSFNSLPEVPSLANVLANFPAQNNDEIKTAPSLGGSATYYGGVWYGLTGGIQPGVMYLLNAQATTPGDLSIMGYPVDVSIPIPIVLNWNWLGYKPQVAISLATALATLSSENNDEIKTAPALGGSATYYGGVWYGLGAGLQPGVGYLLNSSKVDELTYPASGSPVAPVTINDKKSEEYKIWTNPTGKKYTMTIHAMVILPDGELLSSPGSKLAAFKNNECRGVFELFDGPAGKQFQLSVASDLESEEDLRFMVYDAVNETFYKIDEHLDFVYNRTKGLINNPVKLNVGSVIGSNYSFYSEKSDISGVFPNPFKENIRIQFNIVKKERILIEVYNLLGKNIKTLVNKQLPIGNHEVIWNGEDLFNTKVPTGLYMCRMTSSDNISNLKLIKIN